MTVALFDRPLMTAIKGRDVSWEIQRLREDDLDALAAHLLRLDATDRRNRFGAVITDRWLVDFAHCCDPARDIVVVLKRGTQIGGVCLLSIYGDTSLRAAELGISVDAAMRRAGWGTRMLREALRIARRRRVTRLVVHYLRRNLAMAAFVNGMGAVNEEEDGDEVTACLLLSGGRTSESGGEVEHDCHRHACPLWKLCSETP